MCCAFDSSSTNLLTLASNVGFYLAVTSAQAFAFAAGFRTGSNVAFSLAGTGFRPGE